MIEVADTGILGFGYSDQNRSSDASTPTEARAPSLSDGLPNNPPQSGEPHQADGNGTETESGETAEEVRGGGERNQIPGLEASASDCFNRANLIARSLNHSSLSIDHVMLALTMDPSARRLLERVADVAQLRETAMQKLGKNYTRSSRYVGEQTLPPTSDLADLGKVARDAAAEREQLIALSDLINAFPKVNGRLAYGSSETSPAAVIESIRNGLVPKVDDAVTRIETAVRDAIEQQHQSVHRLLEDLSSSQIERTEQRQREFMDEIRRQVREVAETQIGAAIKEFSDRIDAKLAELKLDQTPTFPVRPTEPPKSRNWAWLTLF
jgi:Clp amino terminal domain, pathogenicity island component